MEEKSSTELSETAKLIFIGNQIGGLMQSVTQLGYEAVVIFRKQDKLFPSEVFFESNSNPEGSIEMLEETLQKHSHHY